MKNLIFLSKAFVAMLTLLSGGLSAFAHDFEVNGIYYNYLDKTAKTVSVTYRGYYYYSYSNEYTGAVTIPSSVTYSGTTYSVTKIGYDAFNGCSGLTSVTIPNSVTTIASYAFGGCKGLTSVTIPNSVIYIRSYAFEGCSGLTSIVVENGNSKYDSRNNCNAIIETATNILIAGCKNSIIPNSVTEIGYSAFSYCDGLTSITIPNSVTEIGYSAFEGCSGLTEVNISDLSAWCKIGFGSNTANPLCYAQHLYLNGTEIKNLVIPNDITQINNCAFYGCSGLTSVTIPNSVTEIGNRAFSACYGLKELIIEDGTETLSLGYNEYDNNDYGGEGLFYDCPIEKLYLGRNLSYNTGSDYGYPPFYQKTRLISVTIGNSVTSIGNYAFRDCIRLKELIIEDGTETLSLGYNEYDDYGGEGLFYDCPIEKLYLGRNLSYNTGYDYGYSPFYNCDKLTSVTIGNSVTEIGNSAFYACKGLTSVTIPNSVTKIGGNAFYDCYLKSITSYCMTPPRCYRDTFWSSYSAILKVPEGTTDLYANATEWEYFYNIQEIAGVEDVLIDNVVVKIAVENGNISINGIENPHIEIYNINGKCIYSGNDTTIPVSDTGVYILRINGKSYKIVNK